MSTKSYQQKAKRFTRKLGAAIKNQHRVFQYGRAANRTPARRQNYWSRQVSKITNQKDRHFVTYFLYWRATAAQRAEAFLKVKGLWTETPADNDDE